MRHTSRIPLCALALAATMSAQQTGPELMKPGRNVWQTVLDGVMGGRSSGTVRVDDEGTARFTGKLSLENNGGFSQMRRPVRGSEFAGADGLRIDVRGDGRTYKFDIRVSNARMMAGAFQREFGTTAGQWTQVFLPFDEFTLYSFGRRVRSAPELDPAKIESIGITLADKKPGDFAIELRSIKPAVRGADTPATGGDAGVGNDLASVARSAGLTTLLDLVSRAKLELPSGPVTIFAPTNDAFAQIPKKTLEQLLRLESRDALRQILTYHIAPGLRRSDSVLNARSLPTLAGQTLDVDASAGLVGGAGITAVDVPFEGGVVHVINKVLMPELRTVTEVAAAQKQLKTLLTAVERAGIGRQFARQSGPWTVFAPVDSAFAKLPAGTVATLLEERNRGALTEILGLHVVRGRIPARELLSKKSALTLAGEPLTFALQNGKVTIGANARIVEGDIAASNGVIHLIDSVLLPTSATSEASTRANAATPADEFGRIYALAVDRGARMFNDGNPEACAAVYEVAIETMISFAGNEVGAAVVERLARTRQQAPRDDMRTRAWVFRLALDECYGMLSRGTRQRGTLAPRSNN